MRQGSKRKKTGILLLIHFSIFTALVILGILFWKAEQGRRRAPVYQSVSLSEEAAARAYLWLSQIEEMSLSYQEIKERMGRIELKIVLTPTGEKGRYTQSIAEGSFAECKKQAQAGLEQAYLEVLRRRILAAGGREDSPEQITDEFLNRLMQEAYGVSVSEYLAGCKVSLLPALEEVMEQYSGEVSYEDL